MKSLNESNRAGYFRALLAASTSVAALGLGGAYAQDEPIAVEPQAEEPAASVDTITVTGSRIRRSEIDASAPVFSFGEQEFEDRAFTNVADALNQSPIFGGSITPVGDQAGGFTSGQNQVNLFDLGVTRTLTLLNGRRMVSSTAGSFFADGGGVDLNTIPVSLIERIETVPLTGAATYGSDAIAGTVNIILKEDFEGFEVRGQYGNNFDVDADSYQLATLAGTNFADGRGNLTFSAEYTRDEGLLRCERDYLCNGDPNFVNVGQQLLDGNNDGVFDNVVVNPTTGALATDIDGDGNADSIRLAYFDQRVQLFGPGGSPSTAPLAPAQGAGAIDGTFYQFTPNGQLEACEPGVTPPNESIFFAQGGTCGVDFFDNVEQLRSPVERFNAFSALSYELTDNVRFRQDFLYANTQGEELVNQGGFQTWAFGGTSAAVTLPTSNPFLSDQARDIIEGGQGETQFLLNRFNNDLVGAGANSNETHVFRVTNVLEGDFEYADRDFYWDVSAQFGSSDITTKTFGIVDGRFINAVNAVEVNDESLQAIVDAGEAADLDEALGVLQGANPTVALAERGDIICGAFIDLAAGTLEGFNARASGSGVTDEDLPFLDGCQPLNLFGANAASPEALRFINGGTQQSQSSNEQTIYQANFGGEAFDLPAGAVSFNLGLETRRELVEFNPGMGSIVPITRTTTSRPISGKAVTEEIYGEVLVPLVSPDMAVPLVDSLELTAAARSQEFRTTGPDGEENTTQSDVWTASLSYTPTEDLKLRATYATAFRNPSLSDLFYPATQAFVDGADPCDARFVSEGPAPDVRRANCVAEGIDPNTFTSNISNATISAGTNVGNPALQPEETKAFTFGAVLTPRWVPGFELAVDYYNLEIEEQISFLDFADLAAVCYDSTNYPNEPACGSFERDENFQVVSAAQRPANAALSNFESVTIRAFYDFNINEALDLIGYGVGQDLGDLAFTSFTQHNIQNESQATEGAEVQEDVGDFADPKWLGTFDTAWTWNDLRVTHRLRWQNQYETSVIDGRYYSFGFQEITDAQGRSGYAVAIDNDQDARFLQDMGVAYTFNDQYTIQANVQNLTDREASQRELAAGTVGIDELLGRRYTIRLVGRF